MRSFSLLLVLMFFVSGCAGGLARIHDGDMLLGQPVGELHALSESEIKDRMGDKTYGYFPVLGFSRVMYISKDNELVMWTIGQKYMEHRGWRLIPNDDRLKFCSFDFIKGINREQCRDLSDFIRIFSEVKDGNVLNMKAKSTGSEVPFTGLSLDKLIELQPIK